MVQMSRLNNILIAECPRYFHNSVQEGKEVELEEKKRRKNGSKSKNNKNTKQKIILRTNTVKRKHFSNKNIDVKCTLSIISHLIDKRIKNRMNFWLK